MPPPKAVEKQQTDGPSPIIGRALGGSPPHRLPVEKLGSGSCALGTEALAQVAVRRPDGDGGVGGPGVAHVWMAGLWVSGPGEARQGPEPQCRPGHQWEVTVQPVLRVMVPIR